jgi:hypothetical protein
MKRSQAAMAEAVAVVRVGDLELRLLRVAAERIARLEPLEVADRLLIVAVVQRLLRLLVQALRRPVRAVVLRAAEVERRAGAQQEREHNH